MGRFPADLQGRRRQEPYSLHGVGRWRSPQAQRGSATADLSPLPLAPIAAEMTRLETLFSADKLVRDQYTALTGRIAQENSALQTLETRLTDALGAAARRTDLQGERDNTYGRFFEAIVNEQNALAGRYTPLMAR